MIFRYYGNILVSMQSYFWNVKGVKKFMFGCHTLTHGTKLRRLPQQFDKNLGQILARAVDVAVGCR